ncbi:MAG: SMC-Scp complex subunit ScpB [Patescibacteria group bacterium]|nr:SMC-Scp complex subunit ScpB [Patescibacteria group bacterium]
MDISHTAEENQGNTIAALEAILFLYGEAVEVKTIARLLRVLEDDARAALTHLQTELARGERGLMLLEKHDSYMLVTKPQFASFLEAFVKDDLKEDLTPAAVETLSLIAYFGPIMRAQIDYVRGVNSSFILRNLLIRGLIERTNKGNAYVYEVTTDFLKHMGVAHVSDLPRYAEYQEMRHNIFESAESLPTESITDEKKEETSQEN